MSLYVQPHRSQYEASQSAITHHAGCTWTSGANGEAAQSGGARKPSPDQVHSRVANSEESSPGTPGWSLRDLDLAMQRAGVPFDNREGQGWDAAVHAAESGLYLVLQGDSDQFSNATCSGAFDGDHAIGWHPKHKTDPDGTRWWWIDDPICSTGRWERETTLAKYALKYNPQVSFGAFTHPVPQVVAPPAEPVVTLRYGARKLARPTRKTIRVPAGRKANVRTAPRTTARITAHLANGTAWTAYQVTDSGQLLAGSRRWYGNREGTRWLHTTAF